MFEEFSFSMESVTEEGILIREQGIVPTGWASVLLLEPRLDTLREKGRREGEEREGGERERREREEREGGERGRREGEEREGGERGRREREERGRGERGRREGEEREGGERERREREEREGGERVNYYLVIHYVCMSFSSESHTKGNARHMALIYRLTHHNQAR